jgi:hypothetical protein
VNNVTGGRTADCDDRALAHTDSKMIEPGEFFRPESTQFSEDKIAELVRRADAGDFDALEILLELADSMLLDGAIGGPMGPGAGTH